jgi:hypothetical protein
MNRGVFERRPSAGSGRRHTDPDFPVTCGRRISSTSSEHGEGILLADGQLPLSYDVFVEVAAIAQTRKTIDVGQALQGGVGFDEVALSLL